MQFVLGEQFKAFCYLENGISKFFSGIVEILGLQRARYGKRR